MIRIRRVLSHADYTAGVIIVNTALVRVSIELPWRDNATNVSCIPAGTYRLDLKHWSPHFGECFHIMDVPDRTHCLIHAANKASELKGCIAPGRGYGNLDGEFAVLSSRNALDDIRKQFPSDVGYTPLIITDDWKQTPDAKPYAPLRALSKMRRQS